MKVIMLSFLCLFLFSAQASAFTCPMNPQTKNAEGCHGSERAKTHSAGPALGIDLFELSDNADHCPKCSVGFCGVTAKLNGPVSYFDQVEKAKYLAPGGVHLKPSFKQSFLLVSQPIVHRNFDWQSFYSVYIL